MTKKTTPSYVIIAIVPLLVVALLMLLITSYQKEKSLNKAKILAQEPTIRTTAYTFNYHIGMSKMAGGKIYKAQLVDYVYFVNKKQYRFTKTLGHLNARFDKFKNPQYVLLKYSKDHPEIHHLMLEVAMDSVKMEIH